MRCLKKIILFCNVTYDKGSYLVQCLPCQKKDTSVPFNSKKCEFAKTCPADSQLKFNSA